MILLDTNAVLRLILKDISNHHKKVVEFISSNPSTIRLEVLVEVVYVLEKYYKKSRHEIARILIILGNTENIIIQYPGVVEKSLVFYIDDKIDIMDSILCAFNVIFGYDVFTFDKEMNSIIKREKEIGER